MYRGVASLVGMEVLKCGESFDSELEMLESRFNDYDFFYLHYKKTDSMGEDGNFNGKVEHIEAVDKAIPRILELKPDVLVVTGDHSTPATWKSHSWHPCPIILNSKWAIPDRVERFGERDCIYGGLGRIPSLAVMPLMLAHGGRLAKFGA